MKPLRNMIVVGPGRLGLTLLRSFAPSFAEVYVVGRRAGEWQGYVRQWGAVPLLGPEELPAQAWLDAWLFLAVPDRDLAKVASDLASRLSRNPEAQLACMVHGSGARGWEVFPDEADFPKACLHPAASLAALAPATTLRDLPVTLSASTESATQRLKELVLAAKGQPIELPASVDRRRYHLACSLAANHVTGLVGWATELLQESMAEQEARSCALALARSALQNVEVLGARAALTGPVARGDHETIRAHLAALGEEESSRYQALVDELQRFAEVSLSDEEGAA